MLNKLTADMKVVGQPPGNHLGTHNVLATAMEPPGDTQCISDRHVGPKSSWGHSKDRVSPVGFPPVGFVLMRE
jgi:hypothetical protein